MVASNNNYISLDLNNLLNLDSITKTTKEYISILKTLFILKFLLLFKNYIEVNEKNLDQTEELLIKIDDAKDQINQEIKQSSFFKKLLLQKLKDYIIDFSIALSFKVSDTYAQKIENENRKN